MYRKTSSSPTPPENFELPFEGKLSQDNRWVMMANLIPWEEFEEEYAKNFAEDIGAPALPFRMALGSLIIKERLGTSDRETVEQIKENPYLQYFIGRNHYSNDSHEDASLLVRFRERINLNLVNQINQRMVKKIQEETEEEPKKKAQNEREETRESKNQGQLILDATCSPADISYPQDLGLLNQARVKTEKIIDTLYEPLKEKLEKKPKTYRNLARKNYLQVAKKRRPSKKERRKAIKKQLQYVKRNLSHIDQLTKAGVGLEALSSTQYKSLLVVAEVYRQQQWMSDNKTSRIDNRIVSLSQPHIRPIVRGKAGTPVEFGAKLSLSLRNGYVFLDRIDWNNFNESIDLKAQVEAFKHYTGVYPESVHVDRIYRTRSNRAFCKDRGIRISGPPLGRPPTHVSQEKRKQALEDERIRNSIEGKFGISKRRFSLNRVMTKLPHTSQTAIAITFLVMNLSALLRQFFCLFSCFIQNHALFWRQVLIQVIIGGIINNKNSLFFEA
ncbi:MAG: IS5 family transposase [Symploca sp. SIO2B6]|nr:IS5 family transposase [Symploca sp. SIO2B6]